MVLTGEAGVGKTRLLDYATEVAVRGELTVARVVGTESESQLGFAALHSLLLPFLGRIETLPGPQREALGSAFGLIPESSADRLLVGQATLTLLAEVASTVPLICIVDDVQWLDRESQEIVSFLARRLDADGIGLLLALRNGAGDHQPFLAGIPALPIGDLAGADARGLLAVMFDRGLDERALDERAADYVVAETGGNPLALIELATEMTIDELAGRVALPLPTPLPVGARLEAHFLRQVHSLPERTQLLLLLAAAAPPDDAAVLWRAARSYGLTSQDATPAVQSRLLRLGDRADFRHPLIRSAVYSGVQATQRRRAHAALAAATETGHDGDERRAWHLAAAAVGPDESLARELETIADSARRRGGYSAQAALLLRAAEYTPDAEIRAQRLFAAAGAHLVAGDYDMAKTLLERAAPGLTGQVVRAQAQRLRATLEMVNHRLATVPSILIEAAATLDDSQRQLARELLLEALQSAMMTQRATVAIEPVVVSQLVLDHPRTTRAEPGIADLILDGLAVRFAHGYEAALPILRTLVTALDSGGALSEGATPLGLVACIVVDDLWDHARRRSVLERLETFDRAQGALNALRITLQGLAVCDLHAGRFRDAEARYAENAEITTALGLPDEHDIPSVELLAWQGKEPRVRAAAQVLLEVVCEQLGFWQCATFAYSALVTLELSLGRYQEALVHARAAFDDDAPGLVNRVLPDFIEAAVRAGDLSSARAGLARISERAGLAGTPWALGLQARCQALLADDKDAEGLYRQSLEQLGRTAVVTDLARTHLLFGEWLRRRRRRADARQELETAHRLFTGMGAELFAQRARAELLATGARAAGSTAQLRSALTPKETQIAVLVAGGSTNAEIAIRLFITASTVEYHLNKIFRKLDLTSRRQLAEAMRMSSQPGIA